MKMGGICGFCHKGYSGEHCPNPNCFSAVGSTLHIIPDIPEHYNRGLGMVIRGRKQYQEELRKQGLIEVGNEKRYVSPEYNEKLQEQKTDKLYSGLRRQAMEMLGRSDPTWN